MNKREIKIKKQLINNIRKSVESQFSIIDSGKEHYEDLMNIKLKHMYTYLDEAEKMLNKEEIEKIDIAKIMRNMEYISQDIDLLIELKKFSIQHIYDDISKNNGYKKAMKNYVGFITRVTPNKHLLSLEYDKIQNQIGELISDSFKFAIDEILGVLDLKSFYINCLAERYKEIEESVEEVIEDSNRYKKIFNYKEMNELMISSGFKPIRQTGSHLMFNNGVITIPVPQHTLGKGLSYEVQKQLLAS